MIYRWKKQIESAVSDGAMKDGEAVPKSMYMSAMKKIEELERALGREALEADILKKLRIEGHKITRWDIGLFAGIFGCSLRTVLKAF